MADYRALCYSFRDLSGDAASGAALDTRDPPWLGGRAVRFQGCTIMRPRCGQFVWIVLLAATFFSSEPVSGQIWKQFVPKSRGAAPADASSANDATNPHRPRFASDAGLQSDPNGDGYSLTQDSGPWL